jgi:hypothetical protein
MPLVYVVLVEQPTKRKRLDQTPIGRALKKLSGGEQTRGGIDRFTKPNHTAIVPLILKEILDEQIV